MSVFKSKILSASAVMLLIVAMAAAPTAAAQSDASKVWVLPVEFDHDFGAANGDAVIARFVPTNSLIVRKNWRLVNVALISLADAPGGRPGSPGNPNPVPGPNVFGLTDMADAVLYTRVTSNGLMWGVGAAFGIPIGTDDRLSSGKWSAGPAVRLGYQGEKWRFGFLAANRWSFAGDSDRADVNQLLVRGLVRRELGDKWFFVYSPIITANWDAPSSQRWLVPVGGGIGRSFEFKPTRMNLSLQAYANVVKPDGAPDWVLRLGMTFPFHVPDWQE